MQDDFSLASYDYHLPKENIAQNPARSRDGSKLFILHRHTGEKEHRTFTDLVDYIAPGDILVVNDTRVFPARLLGHKETGGKAEVFLLEYPTPSRADAAAGRQALEVTALVKASKRPAMGSRIIISPELSCIILAHLEDAKVRLRLDCADSQNFNEIISRCGIVPLPPYIERPDGERPDDRSRYQTVYANNTGAVAAPTAGLHFTDSLLQSLNTKGVELVTLTLHVGYGTFAPVRAENILEHSIHREYLKISPRSAEIINERKARGSKVWAVGTTSVRALESLTDDSGKVIAGEGWCDLYITPGYHFKVVDNLITNFHLPQSSLLFLVSALCGREQLLDCYAEAIARGYRFYSYGDAMAILA